MAGTSSAEDRPWQAYNTVYTNAKAGMDGVDKEKVQRVVYEMSKGSKYFENEQRKEAFIKQKIENLRAQCVKLTDDDMAHFQMIVDKRILDLEASRDLCQIWLHTDMDAFYAAVETLENPSLKGKPLAVGSMSMICTANYEARKFGVRAAMPGFIARKLCPDLAFVPTNFEKYSYYSDLTRKVFQKYDPDFIAPSLDEAYLNITGSCNERGITSEEVASELRNAIFEVSGLTCSAGVAPNRMLAKVCSDINKPNGQYILPNERKAVMTFISSLPIRKIGGIGKVTEHLLRDVLGINTCEEMLQKGSFLCALFSPCSTDFFLSVGLGLGSTDTPEHRHRKSISTERTFSATADETLLFRKLEDIAETLSKDMQNGCLSGRTLTLKLKTASFEVRTRALSLQRYIHSKEDILRYASKLLKAELPLSVRLIGLRMSQFHGDKQVLDPTQKTLTSFLMPGDGTSSVTKENESTGSEISDSYHINDGEMDISVDEDSFSNDGGNFSLLHESNDILETNQMASLHDCRSSDDVKGIQNINDASTSKSKLSRLSGVNKTDNSLGKRKLEPSWVDDQICSICGIELPPSFIEERQEHSDYHLAVMIQEEESMNNTGHLLLQERLVPKPSKGRGGAKKKQKPSPGEEKYIIPIDAFFNKSKKTLE